MRVSGIVAMTPNRLIGKFGAKNLPWYLPEDLKLFKQITMGNTVVMGRKTYETRNKALPNRKNIVLTRDPGWWVDDAIVINHPDQLIGVVDLHEHIYIIGGSDIYSIFLPHIEDLHVSTVYTRVDEQPEDIYFPEFLDQFDYYQIVKHYDEFEYGIYRKDDRKRAPVPLGRLPVKIQEENKKKQLVEQKQKEEKELHLHKYSREYSSV